jgi:cellulose synthase/poly-beta-1,6-N-acetylglucosamine synthase-like glycosyltransferase
MLYLLALHLSLRRDGLAREAISLAQPLPPDVALPHLVVQIPTFNEGAIVARAIASVMQLDWPRDKLHIQVCDDSTDETTELARAAAQQAVTAGFDVVVIHRTARSEFKAGALNNAMTRTTHDYFAILDVDYIPEPNFLRQCMTVLLADPKLAFAQARVDFLNANENALTRAQKMMLDYHLGFEQATRSWAKHLLPFNGTCGIWRRAAIDAGGGWHGQTLLEDWDLSLRAWLKGWRGTFLVSVTAKGELPTDLAAWTVQQKRWATGVGQVAWRLLPGIRGNHATSSGAVLDTLMPFGTWLAYAMFAVVLIVTAGAMALQPSWALGLTVYCVYGAAFWILFVAMLVADRTVGRRTPIARFALDFPLVVALSLYVSWASLRSMPATLLGRQRVFVRTPKRGSVPHPP